MSNQITAVYSGAVPFEELKIEQQEAFLEMIKLTAKMLQDRQTASQQGAAPRPPSGGGGAKCCGAAPALWMCETGKIRF